MNPIESSSTPKIRGRHLDRLAIVYVRQSTTHQVLEHRESADLQYQLRQRAVRLGWPESRVLVIDDDQGISGQAIDNRPGFQRLLAEISLGRVGIVFGREVSRLSRSNKDWHQLLELAGLFQVLIGDAEGIYDPTDYNDRLLLGLRGMMSEAELHILRTRLYQGKLNKARRGELFTCVPIGYIRSASGGIELDPDEQVRSVIQLIFERFAALGSVPKVQANLVAHRIEIGVRLHQGPQKGQLVWRASSRHHIYEILRHPFYAGAYVYGRVASVPKPSGSGRTHSTRRLARPEDWLCLLKDRVPAYISWEEYETNQKRLRENDCGRGASRCCPARYSTLLNGRLKCGRCGAAMGVRNGHLGSAARYACDHQRREFQGPICQSMVACVVDEWIESQIFRTVQPASLELSLRTAEQTERDRERLHKHWKQRLERAEYETGLARRRYEAVDPENRLVARELERQWESRLTEQRRLEDDYARFQQEQSRCLTAEDRQQIETLASDLPALWRAETTRGADRRAVVRLLIDQVVLTRRGGQQIEVTIHWRGGWETRQTLRQGLRRYTDLIGFEEIQQKVRQWRGQGRTGEQIAQALNEAGYRPCRGECFTGDRIRALCLQLGLTEVPVGVASPSDLPGREEWWVKDLAAKLKVESIVVHRWRWSGWVHARQLPGDQGRWIIWADRKEIARLRELRRHEVQNRGREAPPELRIPAPCPKAIEAKK
jgi:DNA invertase Pin-like site-specific DNA recombinase